MPFDSYALAISPFMRESVPSINMRLVIFEMPFSTSVSTLTPPLNKRTIDAKKHFNLAARLYDNLGLDKAELAREKLSKYNVEVTTI